MRNTIALLTLVLVASGCKSVSMNVQRSSLRSSGDVGVTIYLDGCKAVTVEGKIAKIKEAVAKVEKFLEVGNAAALLPSQLRIELIQLVGPTYGILVDNLIAIISAEHLQLGKVGEKNVRRIKALLAGISCGLDEYVLEDRGSDDVSGESVLKSKKVIVRR